MATNKLKHIFNSNGQTNVLETRQIHVMKELNKKLSTENAIITQADKGKIIGIINSNEYSDKVHSYIDQRPDRQIPQTDTENIARK
jgi:hypothetical protein